VFRPLARFARPNPSWLRYLDPQYNDTTRTEQYLFPEPMGHSDDGERLKTNSCDEHCGKNSIRDRSFQGYSERIPLLPILPIFQQPLVHRSRRSPSGGPVAARSTATPRTTLDPPGAGDQGVAAPERVEDCVRIGQVHRDEQRLRFRHLRLHRPSGLPVDHGAPIIITDHRVRDGPSAAPPAVEKRLRSVEGL